MRHLGDAWVVFSSSKLSLALPDQVSPNCGSVRKEREVEEVVLRLGRIWPGFSGRFFQPKVTSLSIEAVDRQLLKNKVPFPHFFFFFTLII